MGTKKAPEEKQVHAIEMPSKIKWKKKWKAKLCVIYSVILWLCLSNIIFRQQLYYYTVCDVCIKCKCNVFFLLFFDLCFHCLLLFILSTIWFFFFVFPLFFLFLSAELLRDCWCRYLCCCYHCHSHRRSGFRWALSLFNTNTSISMYFHLKRRSQSNLSDYAFSIN